MINPESKPNIPAVLPLLSVSELTSKIKSFLENQFNCVWVCGEISNYRQPSSGHKYFSLKDAHSQIKAVIFRSRADRILFQLADGLEIIAQGTITVYEPRGDYQLLIEYAEPKGKGALQLAFEQLKNRLSAEGLFNSEHKKPLPYLPKCIGIITSPTGAAIRDILKITLTRSPFVSILIYPVLVQGEEAPYQIAEAIYKMNEFVNPPYNFMTDVLIIGRGGGSLEDLWAFNTEIVARAIFASKIPIISAVGHEIDFTIADFVADKRAATPSVAAELVAPSLEELSQYLDQCRDKLKNIAVQFINNRQERLLRIQSYRSFTHPEEVFGQLGQTLDELLGRMQRRLPLAISTFQKSLTAKFTNLKLIAPRNQIQQIKQKILLWQKKLVTELAKELAKFQNKLDLSGEKLILLSPADQFQRGYAMVFTDSQEDPEKSTKPLISTKNLQTSQSLKIQLAEGKLRCEILQIYPMPAVRPHNNLFKGNKKV